MRNHPIALPKVEGIDRLIRWPELKSLIGNPSYVTVWRWIRKGSFPKALKLGPNSIGWKYSSVKNWIETRPET